MIRVHNLDDVNINKVIIEVFNPFDSYLLFEKINNIL